MNSLISVSKKFMDVTPRELGELVTCSKRVKGLEFCISDFSLDEEKYLDDLVFEIKKRDLIFQVHANSEFSWQDQEKFLKKLESYADYLDKQIVVTFHSLYDQDKELSKIKTANFINKIIDIADNDKLIICLENLNDIPNFDRLEKEALTEIVLNNEKLFFTYDLGHELIDYGNMTNLNSYMIDNIRNVHIHTHNFKGEDHYPIYKNDKNFEKLLKGLIYLVNNKYKYNVVYEYDLYLCNGDTIKDKIKDYLDSIDFMSLHY